MYNYIRMGKKMVFSFGCLPYKARPRKRKVIKIRKCFRCDIVLKKSDRLNICQNCKNNKNRKQEKTTQTSPIQQPIPIIMKPTELCLFAGC
jgi:hypothetical protein